MVVNKAGGLCCAAAVLWGLSFPAAAQAPANDLAALTRADLLACSQNTDADAATDPVSFDYTAFRRLLHGAWVAERTWLGYAVQTNSVLVVDTSGDDVHAMMIDESNGRRGAASERLAQTKQAAVSGTPVATITFIDCRHLVVERHYKVSDTIDPAQLRVLLPAQSSLQSSVAVRGLWDNVLASGFFAQSMAALAARPPIPAGTSAWQAVVAPSVSGAYWHGGIRPTRVGTGPTAILDLAGSYAKVEQFGLQSTDPKRFEGREVAQFREIDGTFVTTRRAPADAAALDTTRGWATDIGPVMGLSEPIIWDRVVISPAR